MHSFTPIYKNVRRPWQVGLLYNRDRRLADALRLALADERLDGKPIIVGDNEPYRLTDETDYTIPVHGERRGLLHIEIELRQDLVGDAAGQAGWAERMARLLESASASLR